MNALSTLQFKPKAMLLALAATGAFSIQAVEAATVYTTPLDKSGVDADTFVTNGTANSADPNKNYGGAGTMVIAGANSGNGIFESLIRFNVAGAKTLFDSTYGAGNWAIDSITLTVASNWAIQGQQPNNAIFSPINTGLFDITWLTNDSWVEGSASGMGAVSNGGSQGVTYNSVPNYQTAGVDELVGSYTYVPPGTNVPSTYSLGLPTGFLSDVSAGGLVSLLFTPGDTTINFLFNTTTFAQNHPFLTITADVAAVPVPAAVWLLGSALVGMGVISRRETAKTQ